MNCKGILTLIGALVASSMAYAQAGGIFTPNDLGCANADGNPPCRLDSDGSVSPYKFETFDGNWGKYLFVPTFLNKGMTLDILSQATFTSSIADDGSNPKFMTLQLKLPFGKLQMFTDITLHTNDEYVFSKSGDYYWVPQSGKSINYASPSSGGTYIAGSPRFLVYQMQNGNWGRDVYLPDHPVDDQLIIIHSDASASSQLHSSSNGPVMATISNGQTLIYKYVNQTWTSVQYVDR